MTEDVHYMFKGMPYQELADKGCTLDTQRTAVDRKSETQEKIEMRRIMETLDAQRNAASRQSESPEVK